MQPGLTLDFSRIAQDLQIRKVQVESVVQLLDEGNCVPFIARYRKEKTGGLSEDVVRHIQRRVIQSRQLADRKQTIIKSIVAQGKLTEELREAILSADTMRRVEDLYLPFKPKKRTPGVLARERGLDPLAQAIWSGDSAAAHLNELLPTMVNAEKELPTPESVLEGIGHILAEHLAEHAEVRAAIRHLLWEGARLTATKVEAAPEAKAADFKDYFQFNELARLIPPHRILAINRGERAGILKVRLDWDLEQVRRAALAQLPLADHPHTVLLTAALDDALTRLILPALEREIRRDLSDAAELHAAKVFARNLKRLLLQPPLGQRRILAIDPGFRLGCRIAALDEIGALLEDATLFPLSPHKKRAESKIKLEEMIRRHQLHVIAVGNGPGCREIEELASEVIEELEALRQGVRVQPSPVDPSLIAGPVSTPLLLATPSAAVTAMTAPPPATVGEGSGRPETAPESAPEPLPGVTAEVVPALPGTTEVATLPAVLPETSTTASESEGETTDVAVPSASMAAPGVLAVAADPAAPGVTELMTQPSVPPPTLTGGNPTPVPAANPVVEAAAAPPTVAPSATATVLPPPQLEEHMAVAGLFTEAVDPGMVARSSEVGETSEGWLSGAAERPAPPVTEEGTLAPATTEAKGTDDEVVSMAAVAELPLAPDDLSYVVVNEAGANVYAASTIGREEFPGLDAPLRAAISIGRRLQDPLAELVKIDPQNIGVGLYQHDVRTKRLKETLEAVVESAVNWVGVDLNTAGVPLLRHISGMNPVAARELFEFRKQNGPFVTREQLLHVPAVGPARFLQAVGFLRVLNGADPLDQTWIHPENYVPARQLLADLGFEPDVLNDVSRLGELRDKLKAIPLEETAARLQVGVPTLTDMIDALSRCGCDPREEFPKPIFRKTILKLDDLRPGMELLGTVLNVVDFGAFVDIGLKDSGLVHISQLANRYVKSPHDVLSVNDVVTVWVLSVDKERKRVSLTMIRPGTEQRPERRERGGRQSVSEGGGSGQGQPAEAGAPRGRRPRGRGGDGRGASRERQPPLGRAGGVSPLSPGASATGAADTSAAATENETATREDETSRAARKPAQPPPRKPKRQPPRPKLSQAALEGDTPLRTFSELMAFFETRRQPPAPVPPAGGDARGAKPAE